MPGSPVEQCPGYAVDVDGGRLEAELSDPRACGPDDLERLQEGGVGGEGNKFKAAHQAARSLSSILPVPPHLSQRV